MKKQALKHNVIDRDKVLVPPNWDSWGKIRVLREGFDVEGISKGWSNDVSTVPATSMHGQSDDVTHTNDVSEPSLEGTVLPIYESTIPDPQASKKASVNHKPRIEVSVPNMQTFLASQQEYLTRLTAEEDKASGATSSLDPNFSTSRSSSAAAHDRISEQIGPVQVNMGGIQVDADDVVRKLQHQSKRDKGESDGEGTPKGKKEGATMSTPDMKLQNEALQSFFSGLIKRGPSNSPRGTPSKSASKEDGK